MSENAKTYELNITIPDQLFEETANIKASLQAFLISNGVESFVEGVIDDLDIDHKYDQTLDDYYDELGGEKTPLLIYDYSLEYLEDLRSRILGQFPKFQLQIKSMDSATWMEGWKESFKPIYSERYIVHPPWDKPQDTVGKQLIEIEPGMAFGTGQHATTQICLGAIESLDPHATGNTLLDVGTGTGVLAIAAYKQGYREIVATDIDHSAVKATQDNANKNSCEIRCLQESVPIEKDSTNATRTYDVVVANILFVVLSKIIGDLAEVTKPNGTLILSGLLEEQCSQMLALSSEYGLSLVDKTIKDDWVCLKLEKK